MKIKKDKKVVTNLDDKTQYVFHMSNFKKALNHEFFLKKNLRIIKFNQNTWLKPHTDTNNKPKTKAKIIWRMTFSSWWITQLLEKLWKILENIELYWTCNNKKEKKLFSVRTKLSYYKFFHEKFISNRNDKNYNINE